MSWYYAPSDKQIGPVSDAEFQALIQSRVITDGTLIWREGMGNWQPYQQVKAGLPGLASGGAESAAGAGGSGTTAATETARGPGAASPAVAAPGPNEVICAECRQVFSRENAINYGTVWVCAGCKPLFVQKLKEGAAPSFLSGSGGMTYAGFWIRFVARFIDSLIGMVVVGIPTMLVVFSLGTSQSNPTTVQILIQVLLQIFSVVFAVGYNTFVIGKYAATPGKMAVGVKVVAPDGSPITFMRAFGRAWADYLSSMTCFIGYIIAAFDNEKRALHDHICSTRVVYKRNEGSSW
jgi:uncharacterized RDD family membrane protein YckC